MEAYPVKDMKEMILFLGALMGLYPAAKADGVIDMKDLTLLIGLVPTAGPAFEGVGNITKEATDVSVEEKAELDKAIDQAFGEGVALEIGEEILQMAVRVARVMTVLAKNKAAQTTTEPTPA